MRVFALIGLALLGLQQAAPQAPAPPASSGCTPSDADIRAATKTARAANPKDSKAFLQALDAAVGVKFGNSPSVIGIYKVFHSDQISVLVIPRYVGYRFALEEQLRKMESLDDVPIPDGYRVDVSPSQISAPDIIKVVVERDGEVVAPLRSTLEPHTFTTRMGAKITAHAGGVMYACSAFQPQNEVVVTAIPESGRNLVEHFTRADLDRMK